MGRRIWVVDFGGKIDSGEEGFNLPAHVFNCRVLSFNRFLPAGPVLEGEPRSTDFVRKKHLVQVWTDPGGLRTLSVGAIRLKDPGRMGTLPATAEA